MYRTIPSVAISSLALLVCVACTEATAQQAPPRIVTVGASVTAGFQLKSHLGFVQEPRALADKHAGRKLSDAEFEARTDSIAPARVLAAAYGDEVEVFGDTMLFFSPERNAGRLLKKAFAEPVDCVIGIDLMFWFGYGSFPGTADKRAQARLDRQQRGFELLQGYLDEHPDTTFVVGDYPDLRGCVPLMISEQMIPTKAQLAQLNERLHAWAAERANVHVYPLSKALQRLQSGACKFERNGAADVVAAEDAFQIARVHPTRLGVAVLVRDLAGWLRESVPASVRPKLATDAQLLVAANGR